MEQYTFIGSLENGKSIFMDGKKNLAIEQDHRDLVEATPEELEGCYKIFPHLRHNLDALYQYQGCSTAFRPRPVEHNTNLFTPKLGGLQKRSKSGF